MSPEFNHGLAPSLTGKTMELGVNVGFKSLQIVGNKSLMPLISFHGQAIRSETAIRRTPNNSTRTSTVKQ